MEARLVTSTNISDPFSLWIQNPTCGNFSLRSICKTWGPLRGGWARDACGLGSWDTLRGSRSRLRITWQDTWSDGWQTPEPPYLMEQWTMGTRQRGLYCSGASWCLRGEGSGGEMRWELYRVRRQSVESGSHHWIHTLFFFWPCPASYGILVAWPDTEQTPALSSESGEVLTSGPLGTSRGHCR